MKSPSVVKTKAQIVLTVVEVWKIQPPAAGRGRTRLLRRHRSLHPADKPLVRADYRHALDVWQWVLRLDPEAGGAVQIAALFHDVERIFTEAESRSEQAVSALDRGIGGVLTGPASYFMKSPPEQFPDHEAQARTEAFIRGDGARQRRPEPAQVAVAE